ncbi:MAG: Holliday junction branch migration DNA helicase RuvB [Firmicutes bacterium]|nr:Holliday junction branch migration DNA helicase RuvB [Clostridiales bacterium]MBR3183110.1 Holliday junction branch migration DNA helicase RuvB [Bacillota bacterium]MBR3261003.1 Holliday junction branch migration DNA helicase RuvB [Bacillota bacterium]MBR6224949.1 Holliday junction branch migration DNA helicase RuvB [Bacillota bacterium]MBR6955779.1 Holliday junction branch migration DNA helicase RuvB [Bacillota bacterium]
MSEDRITSTNSYIGEARQEAGLRPQTLDDYIGQQGVKDNLKIFIEAAKLRHDPLDHVLFYGPPGLGKTTLAGIIANELGVDIKVTSGPAIGRAGDLAAILTNLNDNDVLFIDEIHRLNRSVEEVLYSAMEDYALDIIIGKGPSARSIRLDLARFTLIGATTRAGSLSAPLRDRFGVIGKFELYTPEELKKILRRSATLLNVGIDEESLDEMAKRSRGTPRVANRMLKRIRDFSQVKGNGNIDLEITREGLEALGVDELGLEKLDRDIILTIIERFGGGPVGIDTIAASLGEEKVTLEDVNEPFLIQSGLLYRTQKGRMVSREGYKHFGLDYPEFEEQIEM